MAEFPATMMLEELRELLERSDTHALRQFCEDNHARDVAELVNELDNDELWAFLSHIESPTDGEIYSHLPLDRQTQLAENSDAHEVARLLEHVAPDDRTDLIQELEADQQDEILALMAEPERQETERLRTYDPDTAGAVMSTDFVTLHADQTAEGAIQQLREQASDKETIYYNYVVDSRGRLVGTVSLRDLILADPRASLSDLMDADVITVDAEEPRTEAARKIQEYDLLALPVVHTDHRLAGIVTVDDVIDVTQEEVTEDFHKLGGVAAFDQPYLATKPLTLVRKRVGWLAILFGAGLFTVAAMGQFEEQIEQLPLLAVFVPLIIATGGNSGFQAATVMTRAIALREVEPRHFGRVFGREMIGGLMLGLILATLGFVLATAVGFWMYFGEDEVLLRSANVGIAVGLSVISVVLFGNMVGSMLPFLLLKLGLDPATGSTPFVATVVDVVGLLLYFTIATWWLSGAIQEVAALAGG